MRHLGRFVSSHAPHLAALAAAFIALGGQRWGV